MAEFFRLYDTVRGAGDEVLFFTVCTTDRVHAECQRIAGPLRIVSETVLRPSWFDITPEQAHLIARSLGSRRDLSGWEVDAYTELTAALVAAGV